MAIKARIADEGTEGAGVVIIGAGPAGLCLAAHLQQRRVPFRILDMGSPGESWRRMPPGLMVVSPWKTNWLSPDDGGRYSGDAQLTRVEYLQYLRDYAAARAVHVEANCQVLSVSATGNGFSVVTARGSFFCRIVVNATGYFSNPVRPAIPGAEDTAIPQLHYAEYRGPEQVRSMAKANPSVLLVGKRLSAGQCLLELNEAGIQVALSHRTAIQFGCSDWLWPIAYRNFALLEAMKLRLFGNNASRLDVRMPGGRTKRLIGSGAIPAYPAIVRFEREVVIFEDGRELRPGLVLYATGFAPELKHLEALQLQVCRETGVPLCHGMESIDAPNLYFLGLDMLRNFQSRFLRGIRNDAVVLARELEARLATAETCAAELTAA
jgi:thioredoxin reductase